MDQVKVALFIGARPNIPKAWVLAQSLDRMMEGGSARLTVTTIHSGQHYHRNLGPQFAESLGLRIDHDLQIGSASTDAEQLAHLMIKCDSTLSLLQPDCVIAIGDVNTSLAAALVASRRGIPVIHLEAGLRSRTWDPEEINRKTITACSNYHLATTHDAVRNLLAEGIDDEHVHLVGNPMAEAFICHSADREASTILTQLDLQPKEFILATAHKPFTLTRVDLLLDILRTATGLKPVVFVRHPNTSKFVADDDLIASTPGLKVVEPLPYADFGRLLESAYCAITDSSGVQEECSIAGTPCITLSNSTARHVTVACGSNQLAGLDPIRCLALLQRGFGETSAPPLWDASVGSRIEEALSSIVRDLPHLREQAWMIRRG